MGHDTDSYSDKAESEGACADRTWGQRDVGRLEWTGISSAARIAPESLLGAFGLQSEASLSLGCGLVEARRLTGASTVETTLPQYCSGCRCCGMPLHQEQFPFHVPFLT